MEELTLTGTLLGSFPDDAPTFKVPENYFEHLPSQIIATIIASNLDTELTLNLEKKGPFSTPPTYFEHFSNTVLDKVREMEQIITSTAPLFGEATKASSYHLPEGYFEGLDHNILQKAGLKAADAVEELATISPLLASLKNTSSYEAPNKYFNATDFSEKVQLKTIQNKVVEHPAVKSIKWARWAAAASIIFIFSISGFQFLNSNVDTNANTRFEKSIAKISDARIKDWLSNNLDEADMSGLGEGLATTKNKMNGLTKEQVEDVENEIW